VSRRTLSDVVQVQADQLARYEALIERLLTERAAPRPASQSVELTRGTTGDHASGIKVVAVTQDGETLEQASERARREFERHAARFPLPSGAAHAAPLGDDAA